MAKTRLERIKALQLKRQQLEEQEMKLQKAHDEQQRKERDKRLRNRGEILEKILPDTINLTVEQFTTFLNKTTANQFGRDKLAEIIKANEAKTKSQDTPPPNEKTTPPSAPPQSPSDKPTPPPTPPNESKN